MLLFKIHEGGKKERLLDHWLTGISELDKPWFPFNAAPVTKVPFKSPGELVCPGEGMSSPKVCPLGLPEPRRHTRQHSLGSAAQVSSLGLLSAGASPTGGFQAPTFC